jgi:signal transduction histidine kinase
MVLPIIFEVWLSLHRDLRAPPALRRLGQCPIESYGHQQRRCRRASTQVLILIACCVLSAVAAEPVKAVRRVLFINSLGPSYPYTARIDEAINTVIEKSPYQIELYHEYLETVLFPEPSTQQEFREWYIRKYRDRRPDVIVAIGLSAIRFMSDSYEQFFPDTPVVFCCAIEEFADNLKLGPKFAGAWMVPLPAKTLETALGIQPGTKHVVVVGGVGVMDRRVEALVREHLRTYQAGVEITYLTDLEMPVLIERLGRLPNNTIILYTALSQDAAGTRFIDATQSLPLVTGAANAPVFVMVDNFVGHGTVGGYVTSYAAQAQEAAAIAMRILRGERPQDIPIVKGSNAYMFDWRALQRWGLKESALPQGSTVLYRQPTVWQAYKQYILGFVSLCVVETLLIVGLLWQRAKRRKVEQSLFERLTFETLISDLSTTFINLPGSQVDALTEKSLGRIADFLKMNQVTISKISREQSELIVTSTWRSDEVQPVPTVVKTDQFPWWTKLLLSGEVVLVSDLNDLPEEASGERDYLGRIGAVSTAMIPLKTGDESFGCMSFLSTTHRVSWTEELVKQLKILAEIFSNALMRKRAQEALERVGGKLIDAQEKERSRIARELHDDICQRLTLLSLEIQHATENSGGTTTPEDRMEAVWEHCSRIASDVQAISHELHSSMLDLLGLTAAVKNFCREFSHQQGIVVEFTHTGVPEALPRDVSLCLFRVVQEALHNAAKHSGINSFEVHLQGKPYEIDLEVRDAGAGFSVEKVRENGGLGLISMQERVHLVRGTFAIDSKTNCGTTIRARIPLVANISTKRTGSKKIVEEVSMTA